MSHVDPLTQERLERSDENYVYNVYSSIIGERFSISVAKGQPVSTLAEDVKMLGTVLSENEYGDDSARVKLTSVDGEELRILAIQKGSLGIEIWYLPQEESIINNLAVIGLNKNS